MQEVLRRLRGPELEGFEQFGFSSGAFAHVVYRAGAARSPGLLVMPEVAGFAPGLIGFARRLVDSGFQVYVPWLFGRFGQRGARRNALRLCISREFANLRAGISAPV